MSKWATTGEWAIGLFIAVVLLSCGGSDTSEPGAKAKEEHASKDVQPDSEKDKGKTRQASKDARPDNEKDLDAICLAMSTYLKDFGKNRLFPRSIAELLDKGIITDKAVFVSTLDPEPPKLPNGLPCSYQTAFDRHPDRVFIDILPPDVPLAWDRQPFAGNKRCVVFFDSHIEHLAESQFKAALDALDRAVKANLRPR